MSQSVLDDGFDIVLTVTWRQLVTKGDSGIRPYPLAKGTLDVETIVGSNWRRPLPLGNVARCWGRHCGRRRLAHAECADRGASARTGRSVRHHMGSAGKSRN